MAIEGANPRGRGSSGALLVVAVLVIAANMRITISGVGPLLTQIGDDTGYPVTTLGALTSVPLILWAICSPFAHRLSRRLGLDTTMTWSLVVLAAATAIRSIALPGELGLWVGTVITGAALAVGNVLMPAIMKRDFPDRVAGIMSGYTVALSLVGAIASGSTVPLSRIAVGDGGLGWRPALLLTGVLLPVAVVLWVAANARRPEPAMEPVETEGAASPTGSATGRRTVWRDPVAWLVAAYMGLQAVQFYMLLAWLAPMLVSHGVDETVAGLEVMGLQIVGMAATPFVPRLLRSRARRLLPGLMAIPALLGTIGFIVWPDGSLLWIVLLGLTSGPSLSVALTLVAERAPDHAVAAALSGMSQSVGYAVAAVGPILFGWFHDLTGQWLLPLLLLGASLVAMLVVGVLVGRPRRVFERG